MMILLTGIIAMAIFAWHVYHATGYHFRTLYVAIIALWLANLLILCLGNFWRSSMTNLLLLTYSIGGALVLAEISFSIIVRLGYIETRDFHSVIWEFSGSREAHPILGEYNVPNTTLRISYPDNPRNYFKSGGEERFWNLNVINNSAAKLIMSADKKSAQVTISNIGEKVDWHIQLAYQFFDLSDSDEYVLHFQARANSPRPLIYTVLQGHPPWKPLGVWRETALETQWKKFTESFVPKDDDESARIQFNLGAADPQVEIKDVQLTRRDNGEIVMPHAPQKYWVDYAFNDMGCRGRNYAIPKGPDTFRILALGDSVTMGVGVHEQDTFSAVMERQLNQQAKDQGDKRRYEVINCGVSGWATREERLYYELYGKNYQADAVLLTMVYNDTRSWLEDLKLGYAKRPSPKGELFESVDFINRKTAQSPPQDFSVVVKELQLLRRQLAEKNIPLVIQFFSGYSNETHKELTKAVTKALAGSDIAMLDTSETASTRFNYPSLLVHTLDYHPNELGHHYAAEQLIKLLTEKKIIPPLGK